MTRTYLTGAQVAKRLHVSPKTVGRWALEGKLPFLRTLGGHRRYNPDDIDRIEREMTRPTTHP